MIDRSDFGSDSEVTWLKENEISFIKTICLSNM